ncbi:MAG: glycosyltransferase family 4 protein [Betaproteobacteria bacterium]
MRIALVRQRYTAFGGAERAMADIMRSLETQNAEVTVIARRWPASAKVATLIVDPLYVGGLWRDWGFARRVCRLLGQQSFDLVQAHERVPCCDVFYCSDGVHREWLAQRRRIQSAWGRAGVAINLFHHYMLAVERRLFTSGKLKAVICMSRMVKDEIRQHFGVPEDRLRVIYDGIDEQAFHPRLREQFRASVRATYLIPPDAPLFLFVGSGFERKGVRPFLRAMAQLPPSAHALVVGKDKRINQFIELAAPLGGRVHFTGPQADVKPFYGAADALVFPTIYEPFGKVVLEAMACGLPAISSRKAGASELIVDGVNGYVCDALDIAALAHAMTLLLDRDRRAPMGRAARSVAENITLSGMGAQLADFYRDVMTRNG